jgi:hypothetical protein
MPSALQNEPVGQLTPAQMFPQPGHAPPAPPAAASGVPAPELLLVPLLPPELVVAGDDEELKHPNECIVTATGNAKRTAARTPRPPSGPSGDDELRSGSQLFKGSRTGRSMKRSRGVVHVTRCPGHGSSVR